MANPRKFGTPFGVLNLAMVPISALYLVVGLFGYMKYGENAAGSITLDLPKNEIISNAVKLTLSMSIYICYALSNYVAFDIMWKGLEHKLVNNSKSKTVWEYGFRTSLVLVTFALAVVVPNLEDLISLIGALCLPFVGIALPAIINFLTFINEYRAKGDISFFLFCLRNLMIVIFALFTFIIGVTVSLSTIVDHMT